MTTTSPVPKTTKSQNPDTNLIITANPGKYFQNAHPSRIIGLAPSILAANFANLEGDLKRMMRAKCFWTHLDVMDGHFVPNITFGPPLVESVRAVSPRLFLDAHLMISKPLDFVERFAAAGADLITFHAESVENMHVLISAIRGAGCKVGVSIKPKTSIRTIEPILGKVDMVLVMTVEPGFGGQELMPSALNKVRQLAQVRQKNKWNYLIQVDGGINIKTVGLATAAGANILVAGTAVFGKEKDSVGANVQQLLQAAAKIPD